MATIKNSEHTSSEPAEELNPDQEASAEEGDASIENVSEVARRINILGKLIIPPSPP